MGFNFFSLGNIHACGVQNGKVYFTLPSGHRMEYATQLDVNIPEQTNLFVSNTVAFLLYHEDKMYVGRYDKSISIYRRSDELLIGLNTWEAPSYPLTTCCGFYNTGYALEEIYLDLNDRQTLYISGTNLQGYSKEKIDVDFNVNSSMFSATAWGNNKNYHIYTMRGEPVEIDVWTVQDDVRKRNCRIFL